MLDKIFKMFFIKKEPIKSISKTTILRRESNVEQKSRYIETKEVKIVNTCLSQYFTNNRGLNVLERGFAYSNSD